LSSLAYEVKYLMYFW